MPQGVVKWFNETKGFCFIQTDDGGADLFVHFSDLEGGGFRTLAEGQKVSFEVEQGQRGLKAVKVKVE